MSGERSTSTSLVHGPLVKHHLTAAMVWLGLALLAGLFYSMQLIQHWPLPKIAELSPGRIRMVHTNLIALRLPDSTRSSACRVLGDPAD